MSDATDPVTARAIARVGRTLRDKWRLDRLLGVGGMAAVYAATHRNGSRGAIKMLHVELSVEPEIRARFLREGYVANSVGHPGAVRVLDDDVAEDGAVFLVMELLSGETLEGRWERKGKRLGAAEVLRAMDQLLDVLAAAHDRGIVHRDIKPENVFVNHDGTIKLLDFGIARLRGNGPGERPTVSGAALGTPAFMAPEQAMGTSSAIGPASDLWAVGASMFLLLGGRTVHEADSSNALLIRAATTRARSLATLAPKLPPPLIELVDRALAFEIPARWASARDMQEAVRDVYEEITGGPMHGAPPLSVPAPRESAAIRIAERPSNATTGGAGASTRAVLSSPPSRKPRIAPAVWVATGAGALLAVVAVALAVGRGRRATPMPAQATASSVTTPSQPIASAPASVVAEPPPAPASASASASAPAPATSADDPHAARLSVFAQGGTCEITIDDVPSGKTPIDAVVVPAGERRVTCRLPTGGAVTRRVRAIAGKTAVVAFAMAPVDPMDKRK